jgi:MoaA/NifB/PqqE/SkfB family radical SAM enzyme
MMPTGGPAPAAVQWLELALDYRCNLRCIGCMACNGGQEALSGAAVRTWLEGARRRNIPNLWIGGGEPTLRDDLLRVIATGRRLGFSRILLQTNGMRLAYGRYVDALVAAGLTDVSLNVKSYRADVHDALSRGAGTHALLIAALGRLASTPLRRSADVLLTRTTAPDLPETVRVFAGYGITRFTLWLLSAADIPDADVAAEVPRIAELHAPLRAAAAAAAAAGVELRSWHTPPCALPADLRPLWQSARDLRLEIVDPSGRTFPLESSSFEGSAHPPCRSCELDGECGGPRTDYLALHGPDEFVPLRPTRIVRSQSGQ